MPTPRFLALVILFLLAVPALAMYTVGQTVGPDQAVTREAAAERGWPEGVLALINHPRRTIGWAEYFSECPNDVEHYGFDLKAADDPQALIDLLAKIKLPTPTPGRPRELTLLLDLGRGPKLEFRPTAPVAAEFFLAQNVLDAWFMRLPGGQFGVHKLDQPPTAMAPTLILCVDHEAVDLARLKVPLSITVNPGHWTGDAVTPAEKASVAAIDKFVAAHRARQQAAAATQPATAPR